MIDKVINLISSKHGDGHGHGHQDISEGLNNKDNSNEIERPHGHGEKEKEEVAIAPCFTCSLDPAGDLKEWQGKAEKEVRNMKLKDGSTLAGNGGSLAGWSDDGVENVPAPMDLGMDMVGDEERVVDSSGVPKLASMTDEEIENKKLVRMGMQTAVAIALHNFPEGLATFVAVLEDPKIGAILAVAIGIHNIPEGFCVALPIYYATGNRKKAFWWGALSGMSEPVGALLGWLILANSFSDAIYGLMFGLVAGMMVMISLKELLPTAYSFDPGDTVVTNSLIARSMVVISLSLVLYYV